MEWLGLVCLGLILCYSSYPGKVKRLEHKVKLLSRGKENKIMKLIKELVGKKCIVVCDDALETKITADVLDADDEWVKIRFSDKKNNTKTQIIRIDSIKSIELFDN